MTTQRTISPVDGSVYVQRTLASPVQIEAALESARLAQRAWRSRANRRAGRGARAVRRRVRSHREGIAEEITWQMGRPIRYSPSEVRGSSSAPAT